jgi:hypothetical protein
MARKTVTLTTCDRCKGGIEEEEGTTKDDTFGDPAENVVLYLERKGQPAIKFEDLCKKCSDRVDNLCSQIRLDKDDKKEASSSGSDNEKPPKKTKGKKDKGEAGDSQASPSN